MARATHGQRTAAQHSVQPAHKLCWRGVGRLWALAGHRSPHRQPQDFPDHARSRAATQPHYLSNDHTPEYTPRWGTCLGRQTQAVPAVQESAAARTLPQAERQGCVGGVVQKRSTGGQHALSPKRNQHARRVARMGALAGYRQPWWRQTSLPSVQEGATVGTLPQAEMRKRVQKR